MPIEYYSASSQMATTRTALNQRTTPPPRGGKSARCVTTDSRQALSAEAKTMHGQTYKAIVGEPDRKGILNFDDVVANFEVLSTHGPSVIGEVWKLHSVASVRITDSGCHLRDDQIDWGSLLHYYCPAWKLSQNRVQWGISFRFIRNAANGKMPFTKRLPSGNQ
jgi:hypothetical protein